MSIIPSIITTITYVVTYIIKNKELPQSISAMVYSLPKKQEWIWTAWMFTLAILTAPALLNALPDNLEGVGFATVASLAFCGAMPLVKSEKNTLHDIFGIATGILSQICVAIIAPKWLLVWIVMLVLYTLKLFKVDIASKLLNQKAVFIAESLCVTSLFGSLT